MALTASFSTSQVLGLPSQIVFSDTSTGSDNTITQRRIFLETAQGTYLVESGTTTSYETWAYPISSGITLDVLTTDQCLSITVQWLNGSTVVYTSTVLSLFTLYSKTFFYYLTQQQSANPNLIQDNNYYTNKAKLLTYIDSAIYATEIGSDIYSAQAALDQAAYIIANESFNF